MKCIKCTKWTKCMKYITLVHVPQRMGWIQYCSMTTNPGLLSLRLWNASPVNMPRAHKMGHLDVRTYVGGFYCGDCNCSEHVVLLGIKQHHVHRKATIRQRVRSIGWDSGWDLFFFVKPSHQSVSVCVIKLCQMLKIQILRICQNPHYLPWWWGHAVHVSKLHGTAWPYWQRLGGVGVGLG